MLKRLISILNLASVVLLNTSMSPCSLLACLRFNLSSLVLLIVFLIVFPCFIIVFALLVVDLSLSQSLLLWFAQHLESHCSLLPRLSQPFLFCVEHLESHRLLFRCLWRLSKYLLLSDRFL